MNCLNHPDIPAVAFCRSCGKPLCEECKRPVQGTVFCAEHAPSAPAPFAAAQVAPPPGSRPVADPSVSPPLAFVLGLIIPGVGAIYNGQYAKGLVHAIIFGLLVSVLSSGSATGLEVLFSVLLSAWVFYMGMEAYHTARKRRAGEPVDEFSSLMNLHSHGSRFPAGAVVLIVVGMLLLLNTTDIVPLDRLLKYWPVLLIVLGVYLLYGRLAAAREASPAAGTAPTEVHDDHR
jgi:TM2 domain-containing membrane protein YozV